MTPLSSRTRRLLITATLAAAACGAAAQSYPTRPIVFKSGIAPGSTVDGMAREVAKELTERLGQSVIVEPVPGAGGIVAAQRVINAPPDGHTFLVVSNGLISSQAMRTKAQVDLHKDLVAVAPVIKGFFGLYVNAELPIRTLAELTAYAKANPGKLNYASTGIGGIVHLVSEDFKIRTGLDIVHAPYKGGGELLPELLANRVQLNFSDIQFMKPQLEAGKVRLLAVTAPQRLPQLPNAPTFEELGLKGFTPNFWVGMYASAATPEAVIARINGEMKSIVTQAQFQQRQAERGYQTVWMSPADAQREVLNELAQMNRTITASKIERQ